MAIQEMERLGNPLSIPTILHANDISQPTKQMHMSCMPKLVRKTYMKLGTCKQILLQLLIPISSYAFLLSLFLLAPKLQVCHTTARVLQETLSVQEYERERD